MLNGHAALFLDEHRELVDHEKRDGGYVTVDVVRIVKGAPDAASIRNIFRATPEP